MENGKIKCVNCENVGRTIYLTAQEITAHNIENHSNVSVKPAKTNYRSLRNLWKNGNSKQKP